MLDLKDISRHPLSINLKIYHSNLKTIAFKQALLHLKLKNNIKILIRYTVSALRYKGIHSRTKLILNLPEPNQTK